MLTQLGSLLADMQATFQTKLATKTLAIEEAPHWESHWYGLYNHILIDSSKPLGNLGVSPQCTLERAVTSDNRESQTSVATEGRGEDIRLPGIHSVVTPPYTVDDRPPPDNTAACPSPPATASTPSWNSELRTQKWKRESTSPQRPSHPITNLYAPGDAPLDSQHPSTRRNMIRRSSAESKRRQQSTSQSQHRIRHPLRRQREADHMRRSRYISLQIT